MSVDKTDSGAAFEIVLASTVHDMKNSLGMLLSAVERITSEIQIKESSIISDYNVLQYEAKRTNNALVKLLSLYKMEKQQLPLMFDYHFLDDFLLEQLSNHSALFDSKNLCASQDVEEDLEWCFDENLIGSVLNDVITNSIRYTHGNILISASAEDDQLVITVNDDGDGYPKAMLNNPDTYMLGVDFSTGSTGLGLYFAANVAKLHKKDDTQGKISLSNGGPLGGGVFKIYLP